MLNFGGSDIKKIYFGDETVKKVYFGDSLVYQSSVPYLIFSGTIPFSLRTYSRSMGWNGKLEYSTNGTTWTTWSGAIIFSGANNELYLRGTGNSRVSGSSNYSFVFQANGTGTLKISCIGNIENLLDYQTVAQGSHPIMDNSCFAYLFNNCTQLVQAPELRAISLSRSASYVSSGVYAYMFNGCTSLISAPELPATLLGMGCYDHMFYGCFSLITAPALPATALMGSCYQYMFQACSLLESLPELPATALQTYCYYRMFAGCSKIKLKSGSSSAPYTTEYRIPSSGTIANIPNYALIDMFGGTGGSFTGTPDINTTYYTSNTVIPAN